MNICKTAEVDFDYDSFALNIFTDESFTDSYKSGICVNYRGMSGGMLVTPIIATQAYNSHHIKIRSHFNDVMKEACVDWELYSGNHNYPITDGTDVPYDVQYKDTRTGEYFLGTGGARRLELIARMVDVLETRIATNIKGL